ncbi:uncharacterized protein BXZ73DRAFT_48691 [Epithele typhae]|uniref:uncharacterized protein n=1 Tax=Epithele typhae TaxID=378194 RepID=UPI0020084D71|nr:uncharacterized protein BXZ73DRAFT_48691 [Epithele typhae]KAH9927936.1 hypothetical protein BXZ73DRAFT_48691 [Epithele typhae]
MTTNLSFSSTSPFNSLIVDTATGETLFETTTPFKFGARTTTLYNPRQEVVGMYERRWGRDTVTFHGETHPLSEWLPHCGAFASRSRRFSAPNGKAYEWRRRSGAAALKLVATDTGRTVAKAHRAHRDQQLSVDLEPELAPFLDEVMFSFIICEERRRRTAYAAAAVGGSTTA